MTDTDSGTVRVERDLAAVARTAASTARVVEVGPTGVAAAQPHCLLTRAGTTAYHTAVSPEGVRDLVAAFEAGDDTWTTTADAVVEHGPDPRRRPQPSTGPFGVGVTRALGRCGWVDPTAPPDGDARLERAAGRDPETVEERVREAGVLGRGRGDARRDRPIAPAWETARRTEGSPVVVVNGTETDPRVRGDALLLDGDAAGVLDAACAVAHVVGGDEVVVAVPETADRRARQLTTTAERLDTDCEVHVVAAPADYLVSEPTITLEAMEGADRLEARRRPPGPAAYGLYGRPTVVHTPRTLAQVRELLGGEDELPGTADDPGTRVVTVTGDVASGATVELPTDASLSAAAEAVTVGDGSTEPKMVCVGGRFGGLTDSLDHPVATPALDAAGLGTEGSLELFDDSRCAVLVAGTRSKAAAAENCGRCVPCREGTTQLTDLLRAVYRGDDTVDRMRELVDVVGTTSLCSFGRDAVRPVETAIRSFRSEFEAHANGRCPSGACRKDRLEEAHA